jgi:tetratricopeptide (TPR) repeat protein
MGGSLVRRVCGAPRWLRVIAVGGFAVGTIAGWILWRSTQPAMSSCERAVRRGDQRHGVEVCLASFARTGNENDLSWAAQACMYLGELDQAETLARELLAGPLQGEGHRTLGNVMLQRGSGDNARMHAEQAIAAHERTGDELGLTSDAVLLARATWKVGDFAASLDAADRALSLARRLHDPHNEWIAHVARADALRRMGDTRGADTALTSAIERATDPCEQAWSHLKRGMLQSEVEQEGMAMLELKAAAAANGQCGSRDISTSVALNQAWLLRWKDPAGALARLDEVDRSEGELFNTLLLRGYLAADRGALAEADDYLTRAAAMEPPDADWSWQVARVRAELFEQRGELFGDLFAEYQYRQAIAMIAALRSSARARSAYLVSSHRGPYDGLIALLARSGRWHDALAMILDLDASDMLRATAAEVVTHDHVSLALGTPDPDSIVRPPSTVEDVLEAWRARDLAIVIAPARREIGPGRERAYRLRIADGQVTGEDVADAGTAWKWADALFSDPGDKEAARALGRMIVPPGAADDSLHVLAIGTLGKVPLAALRDDDGSPIIARRPLVRVLALRASGPEAGGAGPPVVIADPRGDLPGAAVEGSVVAAALGSAALVSGSRTFLPATRARLWAARDAAVLHIAAHVGDQGRWRTLRLADGDVDPAEMVRGHLAPHLAVLAGCGSAAAMDGEGWGSIAAALLESGTPTVIATDRSVGDAASLSVVRDFYAQPDWRADPARALARVQRALDARAAASNDEATKPRSWAAFSVLRRPPAVPWRAIPR